MIGSYSGDKINVLRATRDSYGGITNTVISSNVPCYIEDYNKIVLDQNGKEVLGNTIIFVDVNDLNDIQYNDRIQLVSRGSENLNIKEKGFEIKKLAKTHTGFNEIRAWEIIL
jgi:arginine/ornithine N-succinyltransferase beta subunit